MLRFLAVEHAVLLSGADTTLQQSSLDFFFRFLSRIGRVEQAGADNIYFWIKTKLLQIHLTKTNQNLNTETYKDHRGKTHSEMRARRRLNTQWRDQGMETGGKHS